jgi:CubicO group peptidase (beta-lactamase class C family)
LRDENPSARFDSHWRSLSFSSSRFTPVSDGRRRAAMQSSGRRFPRVCKSSSMIGRDGDAVAFGHGGAYGTQGWTDPKKDSIFVLMIQRAKLPNAHASETRRAFQDAAVTAIMK